MIHISIQGIDIQIGKNLKIDLTGFEHKDVLQVFDYFYSNWHGYRIVFSIIPIDFAPMIKFRRKIFPNQAVPR